MRSNTPGGRGSEMPKGQYEREEKKERTSGAWDWEGKTRKGKTREETRKETRLGGDWTARKKGEDQKGLPAGPFFAGGREPVGPKCLEEDPCADLMDLIPAPYKQVCGRRGDSKEEGKGGYMRGGRWT